MLESAMEPLKAQAEAIEIDLRLECTDVPKNANIDGEKIAWAVTTLVGNAFRFVKHGTRLHPGGSIHVRLHGDRDAIAIDVQDDGPGIPKDKLPQLFERAKDGVHAAGLALLLIHDVIVAHGGTIDVTSARGHDHGTLVHMRIPT